MVEWLLPRLEVVIAVLIILGAVKSIYNGYVFDHVLEPLERVNDMGDKIDDMGDKQEKMYQRQEVQVDAITALARSHEEDGEFDEETFRERVGRSNGPSDFLRGGSERDTDD